MQRRVDGDIAELSALVAGVAGAKKQNGSRFTPSDFCVWVQPDPEPATLEEAFQMFKAMAGANNG